MPSTLVNANRPYANVFCHGGEASGAVADRAVLPKAGNGRPLASAGNHVAHSYAVNWFVLSDPEMEESLYEITSLRQLFQLSLTQGSIPEGKTIMNFRHLLQQHRLAAGILEVTNVRAGCRCARASSSAPRSSMRLVRPRAGKTRVIWRCSKRRRAASISSA